MREYVADGGHLVMSFFSGMLDSRHHARLGGTPGGLREVFGIRVEEFCPLPRDSRVILSNGESGTIWSERLRTEGGEVVAAYADGPLAGLPAITRNAYGRGQAWYVSTCLGPRAHDRLIAGVLDDAGVVPAVPGAPAGLEAVRRHGDDGRSWLFVLNHTAAGVQVPVSGLELLSGRRVAGQLGIAPGGVAVVRGDGASMY
jgi:beta-galactosidase